MNTYMLGKEQVDSIELKCLVVSRGLKVSREVYRRFSDLYRLNISPLTCNCLLLSDGTIVQLTDMGFHLQYLGGMLSWDNLKLLKYASQLGTPFTLEPPSVRVPSPSPWRWWKTSLLCCITVNWWIGYPSRRKPIFIVKKPPPACPMLEMPFFRDWTGSLFNAFGPVNTPRQASPANSASAVRILSIWPIKTNLCPRRCPLPMWRKSSVTPRNG